MDEGEQKYDAGGQRHLRLVIQRSVPVRETIVAVLPFRHYTKREAELLILQITEKVLSKEHEQVVKDISQHTPEEPREREEL